MSEASEHHIAVTKTARYWTVGDAATADEVWFVLHGYKQLAQRFLKRFAPIEAEERLIVAPEALSRFYVSPEPGRHGASSIVGATWMTREDRLNEIDDYVGYLDRLAEALDVATRRVVVLGFSQGVATATRWVVHGSIRPERLVCWGDFTPPDLDLVKARTVFGDVALELVRGDEDPALDRGLAAEEAARLRNAGIAYRTLTYHGGHEIDPGALRSLLAG